VVKSPLIANLQNVKSHTVLYGKYFHKMLNRGVYLAPAQFEAAFVSTAHSLELLLRNFN
jgi:glutamate-1-semialdehyde 2,1-aminomutase